MCSTQPAQLYARAPVGAAEGSFDLSPAHNSLPCESSETCSLLISLPEQRGVVGRVHRHWPCPSTLESRPAVVDRLQSPEYCPASALPYFVTTGKPLLSLAAACVPLYSQSETGSLNTALGSWDALCPPPCLRHPLAEPFLCWGFELK